MPPMVIVSAPLAWPSVIDTLPPVAVMPPLPETVMLSLAALPALIVTDEPRIDPFRVMASAPAALPSLTVMVVPTMEPSTVMVSLPVATPSVTLTVELPFNATCAVPLLDCAAPIWIRSFTAAPSLTVIAEPVTSPLMVIVSFVVALPSVICTVDVPLTTTAGLPVIGSLAAWMVMVSL